MGAAAEHRLLVNRVERSSDFFDIQLDDRDVEAVGSGAGEGDSRPVRGPARGIVIRPMERRLDWHSIICGHDPQIAIAVSGSDEQTLRVWNLERLEALRTLEGHTGRVSAVAATPDGQYVVSGSDDKTLKVWDVERGKAVRRLTIHTDVVLGWRSRRTAAMPSPAQGTRSSRCGHYPVEKPWPRSAQTTSSANVTLHQTA